MSEKEPSEQLKQTNKKLNTIVIVQICTIVFIVILMVATSILLYRRFKANQGSIKNITEMANSVAEQYNSQNPDLMTKLGNIEVSEKIDLSEMSKKVKNVLSDENIKLVKEIGTKIKEQNTLENINSINKNITELLSKVDMKKVNDTMESIKGINTKLNNSWWFKNKPGEVGAAGIIHSATEGAGSGALIEKGVLTGEGFNT